MKKTLSFILALVMIATMFAVITVPASAADAGKVEGSVYDGTMDKTWYNAEDPKTEYTLYTAAELAGLADLVNTDGVKFDGVTIKLGADIIWNEGTFTLGKDNKTPVYNGALVPEDINVWPVIGERPGGGNSQAPTVKETIDGAEVTRDRKYFYGNFDGQGHVISGLYVNTTGAYAGFTSVFFGEYIKNLSIVNSFFGCDARNGVFSGFVANDNTKNVTFENLYTDAIIVNNKADGNARTGGIFGMMRSVNNIKMANIWFDGTISALGSAADKTTPFVGGLVGVICEENDGETIELDSCLVTGIINAQVATDATNVAFGGLVANIYTNERMAPVVVNVKNCLVAVESTNLVVSETLSQVARSAFIGRFEKSYATYTVENSYFVPMGVFGTGNTVSSVVAGWGGHEYDKAGGYANDKKADTLTDVTFNGTLIQEASKLPETETVATAKIAKIADAQGLEAFDLTGKTAALKGIRTGLVKNFSIWDGTVNTSWFDANDVKTEYTLTTAAQFAGFAALVDAGNKFEGVTVKLGANIVLNTGTFTLGADNKTPVYNGALISATNPVNVWNPIGTCNTETNNISTTKVNVFWGNFDGQGYVISGMYVDDPKGMQQGLFSTFAGTEIKNVVLTNSYVRGDSRTGSVVGFFDSDNKNAVNVENIYSDAIVVGEAENKDVRTGGLFGMFRNCQNVTIKNADFAGIVSGICNADSAAAMLIGGIVGVICGEDATETYTFTDCDMTGSLYLNNPNRKSEGGAVNNAGERRTGGIMGAGFKFYGSFTNCSVEIAKTNITTENGFEINRLSAFVGYYENAGDYTYTDCTFTHVGAFVNGIDAKAFSTPDTCNVNGMTGTAFIAAGTDIATGAHVYTDVAGKEATCTEAGIAAHKVCVCGSKVDAEGKEIADVTVAAKGHTYGEWVAPVDPTETAAGVLGHYQCSVCKKYFDADKNEMTSIEGAPALGTTPGTDPGTTPGTTPGTDPGTTPGTEPGVPGTEPGTPDTEPGTPDTEPGTPDTDPVEPGTTPTTNAPTTDAPVKEKGCGKKNGGFAAVVALVAIMGAAIVIKKK